MKDQTQSAIKLLEALTERAKELTCLYAIEELLKKPNMELETVCEGVIAAVPPGWQYPEICRARIMLDDRVFQSADLKETQWMQSADIIAQEHVVGHIQVFYTQHMPDADFGPFLKEEKKLIETIADRLGHFIVYKRMEKVVQEWQSASRDLSENRKRDWEAVLDLLRQTDSTLFLSISNKMLNHLCWSGIGEAENLRQSATPVEKGLSNGFDEEATRQHPSRRLNFSTEFIEKVFQIASDHLSGEEILSRIQMWIQEDRLSALVQIVQRHLPLSEVTDALRRYHYTAPEEADARYPVSRGLKVSLIRRILSDRLDYVNLMKKHVDIEDLYKLLQKVIFSPESHGKLGAKSAEFYLASQVLKKAGADSELLSGLRIPKTWYISSDMMLHLMHYNNIDEIIEQKYKETDRIRLEYQHIVQTFVNCVFPPEMVKGLSIALDDFGENPLIVRSSSTLEECIGSDFICKYRSTIIANQGTKQERLSALMRAVAEVYASAFSPEPIDYRTHKGVLDFSEEMGIMIQEAVGQRVGPYFLPAFSGVAYSRNDFRWSHKIRREDGLARIVPGFGIRLARNAGGEHPFFFSPGQPGLKVNDGNGVPGHYAPKTIEVINLETGALETLEIADFVSRHEGDHPKLKQFFSSQATGLHEGPEKGQMDFGGLISQGPFVLQIRAMLKLLEEKHETPVEIHFASDGKRLFFIQCGPQRYAEETRPATIPKDLSPDQTVFSAKRYVSNGRIRDISHIVYIDRAGYQRLVDPADRGALRTAIGRLNRLLPKKQFILMAPGRWCGVDDDRSGFPIRYSDIDKAALLVEMADNEEGPAPNLSFASHFFQELVASGIRYMPLYPESEGTICNERFLKGACNILPDLLPEYGFLADTLRLIDIPKVREGKVMQVLMNADLDEAVGILTPSSAVIGGGEKEEAPREGNAEHYWRWRYGLAEQIASELDPGRFGVAGFYLFGSTKNGTAGPGSDIDILVHFRGTEEQRKDLEMWLEGWSLCLDEMNYLQTGYRSNGLLDVHVVTDEDIAAKTSFAVKINAVTDAARPLKMKAGQRCR